MPGQQVLNQIIVAPRRKLVRQVRDSERTSSCVDHQAVGRAVARISEGGVIHQDELVGKGKRCEMSKSSRLATPPPSHKLKRTETVLFDESGNQVLEKDRFVGLSE